MRARAAANQLTKALRSALPRERWFPVDPAMIARELKILVVEEDLGLGMEGAMLASGSRSAIVVSTRICDPGRKRFTTAHELGHYSLHKDREELLCSIENLLDVAPHPSNIEQEANEFAMTLLMPADDVREQAAGKEASIEVVKRLAVRYQTSLTATALRLREVSDQPIALCFVQRDRVKWFWPSTRFPWRLAKGSSWPQSFNSSDAGRPYATGLLGEKAVVHLGSTVFISGVEMPTYDASLWILHAPDARQEWMRRLDQQSESESL
jgi:Zn-dependent peptidase ImmA (M78 family)